MPAKKEEAPGNVKHEAANYDSLSHRHWALWCGTQIKVTHLHINTGKTGPVILAAMIATLHAFITMTLERTEGTIKCISKDRPFGGDKKLPLALEKVACLSQTWQGQNNEVPRVEF